MEADPVVFEYSLGARVAALIVGALLFAVLLTSLFRRWNAVWSCVLAVGTLLCCGIVAPSLWMDRVEFQGNQYTRRTGFWFAANLHVVDLTQVKEWTKYSVRRRRDSSPIVSDRFIFNDGRTEDVPTGDLYRAHSPAINEQLKMRLARAQGKPSN